MDEHLQTLDKVKSTVIDMAMQFGPKLVVAIIIIAAGVYAGDRTSSCPGTSAR